MKWFLFENVGYGGYTYLLEPLWWAGMTLSECSSFQIFNSGLFFFNSLMDNFVDHFSSFTKLFTSLKILKFSVCWRGCKLCGLRLCSSCFGNTTWSIKYYNKVNWIWYLQILSIQIPVVWFQLPCLFSAVLAHFMLKERLSKLGVLGCVSCIVGSVVIVLHAPQEETPTSVQQIWDLASQPGYFLWFLTNYIQT